METKYYGKAVYMNGEMYGLGIFMTVKQLEKHYGRESDEIKNGVIVYKNVSSKVEKTIWIEAV